MNRSYNSLLAYIFILIISLNLFNVGFYVKANLETNLVDNDVNSDSIYVSGSYRLEEYSNNNYLINISYTTANLILRDLLEVEKNFTGLNKIEKQVFILKNYGFLARSFSFDKLFSSISVFNFLGFRPKSLFGGPFLVSHLTLNGRIKGLIPFWEPKIYFEFLNESEFHGVVGILPIYVGVSRHPVFISAFDFSSSEFFGGFYFRFFELMLPCCGFSLCFYDFDKGAVLFEYNLDFCLFGFFVGF